jgi:sugar fermentation stimulation protein A
VFVTPLVSICGESNQLTNRGPAVTGCSEIYSCKFVERPNRFLGRVLLDGKSIEVFIPNPGRMYELLVPGRRVFIRRAYGSHRKTAFDMVAVEYNGLLVSIDSLLANRFVKHLLTNRRMEEFIEYNRVIPEPRLYEGRFDFKLERDDGTAFIEVKSCTLVEDGHARFPDAPTTRGARHMRSLARALTETLAERAAVVFIIQRPDALLFSPNDPTDPDFGNALREAVAAGVEAYALGCRLVDYNLKLEKRIPVDLDYFIRGDAVQ